MTMTMAWKSARKRSVTFRKRRQRDEPFAWSMQPYRETGPRVMTCMALVMPENGSGLGRAHNWIVLISNEIKARAYQHMTVEMQGSYGFEDDDDQPDE
ncbi:hypothetical protein [Rhizobium metallidurans]|uniref:Uncharacterized protein n=1 Tax=Rhizobium metallidurans TaxID=1265931 RepID=A0A7W6CLB9_9HYPH|nr:hypothetical protein [Rhizobium metallidurans]MBB3963133.1 hypothetical protein [Rhizobium metallidurans]